MCMCEPWKGDCREILVLHHSCSYSLIISSTPLCFQRVDYIAEILFIIFNNLSNEKNSGIKDEDCP